MTQKTGLKGVEVVVRLVIIIILISLLDCLSLILSGTSEVTLVEIRVQSIYSSTAFKRFSNDQVFYKFAHFRGSVFSH